MPNRVDQRINIRNIPHQKEDAHSLNQFFASDAADFKPGRISGRANDEQNCGLQVEENNQPDKQARELDSSSPSCLHVLNYTFSRGESGVERAAAGTVRFFF